MYCIHLLKKEYKGNYVKEWGKWKWTNEPESKELFSSIIKALGKIGDKRAVSPLINVLENTPTRRAPGTFTGPIRVPNIYHPAIAKALGKIGDKRAIEPLVKLLDAQGPISPSLDRQVHQATFKALDRLGHNIDE